MYYYKQCGLVDHSLGGGECKQNLDFSFSQED